MGDTYNNVGATGLVARSNPYCPVIMGDNIIFWQLGGDNWVVMDRMFVEYTLVNQPLWDHPLLGGRYWTGRPDRSPLHSWGGHSGIAF